MYGTYNPSSMSITAGTVYFLSGQNSNPAITMSGGTLYVYTNTILRSLSFTYGGLFFGPTLYLQAQLNITDSFTWEADVGGTISYWTGVIIFQLDFFDM
jgi:hypothetical protein